MGWPNLASPASNRVKSNFNKLKNNIVRLNLMNVFKNQESQGIIERVHNLDSFLEENPNHSFVPHMGVFKMNLETTKCRIIYLSNLCQKNKNDNMTVSHNQAIFSGPCLNHKLSTSLLYLRFDYKLLIFDLEKKRLTKLRSPPQTLLNYFVFGIRTFTIKIFFAML